MSGAGFILIAFGVLLVFMSIMLLRNQMVYSFRSKLLWSDLAAYQRLPSYDRMLWYLTVWNFERYLDNDS